MNLTELENQVLTFICQFLSTWRDDEPGYSCLGGDEIAPALKLGKRTTAGVIGSLCKKGFITSEDGDFDGIIYANWEKIPNDFAR